MLSTAKDDSELIRETMRDCTLCPRECHADRQSGRTGYCGQTAQLTAARAALHFWEEPCISGTEGSGAVFFSGCGLRCGFCQNYDIAHGRTGQALTVERLAHIFLSLQAKGANNINLVTPSHFVPQIRASLLLAKKQGLSLPIVYNTGSYEKVSTLRLLEGLVDIYLPDLKYCSSELSRRYSHAEDYFSRAREALAEMYRQVGPPVRDASGRLLRKGMIVRHLLLPGQTRDSRKVLRYLHDTYGSDIFISIMNQYTPLPHTVHLPEINRPVSDAEYERVLRFAEAIGIENGFVQEGGTVGASFIPAFDGEGL